MQKTAEINLAKGRGITFLDKFITWALTTGRILVILTEAIALGAFIYRFTLDRQIIDLHDKITQEEAIVQFLSKNEAKYRNLQTTLDAISKINKVEQSNTKVLNDIESYIPNNMEVNSIDMLANEIQIQVTAPNIDAIAIFVEKLQAYPLIQAVSIDKIENKTSTSTIIVGLSATFKKTASLSL